MKNPCRFVAVVATLCLFAGAAIAQTPSKSVKLPKGNGNGGGAGATGNVLCDDPCNNAQYGFASQNFADFASFSSSTYDDCPVPDGESWSVAGFCMEGFYNYSPHCPVSYTFCVVADAGGAPNCGVCVYSTDVPVGGGVTDGPNCLGFPDGKLCYCPGGTLTTLSAGNWWYSAQVNMPFAYPVFCGQWYWTGSTTPHRRGGSPYLDNPGGGFGIPPCYPWTGPLLGLDQDLAFTVFGTSGGCTSSSAGTVDTGNGNPPANVLTVDGGVGPTVTVDCSDPNHQLCLSNPPSVKGKFHYAVWVYGPYAACPCTATEVNLTTGKGVFYVLQSDAPQCLPTNNTTILGPPCPCPAFFSAGRTSKSFGAGTAAVLCVAKKTPFPKGPTCFTLNLNAFGSGDYFLCAAVVQDLNSPNSPAKNVAVANWVCVCCI